MQLTTQAFRLVKIFNRERKKQNQHKNQTYLANAINEITHKETRRTDYELKPNRTIRERNPKKGPSSIVTIHLFAVVIGSTRYSKSKAVRLNVTS